MRHDGDEVPLDEIDERFPQVDNTVRVTNQVLRQMFTEQSAEIEIKKQKHRAAAVGR